MTRSIFKYESSYEYGKNDSDRRVNYIQIVDFCEVEVLLKQMLYVVNSSFQSYRSKAGSKTYHTGNDQKEVVVADVLETPHQKAHEVMRKFLTDC